MLGFLDEFQSNEQNGMKKSFQKLLQQLQTPTPNLSLKEKEEAIEYISSLTKKIEFLEEENKKYKDVCFSISSIISSEKISLKKIHY